MKWEIKTQNDKCDSTTLSKQRERFHSHAGNCEPYPKQLIQILFLKYFQAFLPDHSLIEDKAQHISTNIKF